MAGVNRWIGISGSWRTTTPEIEQDVRETVRHIILEGAGIISGGALNVDYQATDEVLKLNRHQQIKVFLPTTLDIYATHYRKRAQEKAITEQQAEDLISQLITLKNLNPHGLIENPTNTEVNEKTYFERNSEIVNASDELVAFQVNNSPAVQDTIDKAKTKGIPVKVHSYEVK
ncbi:MAG: hypothetical protein Q7R31_03160 [Candidatus Levybacteria bacterium]|nr:hypothetical protein [Candidatus Levybacteria bacterium]